MRQPTIIPTPSKMNTPATAATPSDKGIICTEVEILFQYKEK